MEEIENYTKFWLENLKGRDYLGDLSVDGRVILKWILTNFYGGMWTVSIWLRIGNWRALVNTVMNLRVPQKTENLLISWATTSLSRMILIHGVSYLTHICATPFPRIVHYMTKTWYYIFLQWLPGVLSPGVKCGQGVMLTTHPHLVPRLSMSRSYTSSPSMCLHVM
jgi:hypothetical protein